MKKWTFIIDVAKCHDCNNCFLACKDEFCDNDHLPYSLSQPHHGHRWINIDRTERGQYPRVDVGYLAQPCMHCDDPSCAKAANNEAVYKRDDGIVIIDPTKAKGQKELVASCPYNAIWWNAEKEVPQKCTFCAHLLDDGWKTPRCVQACPTGALSVEQLTEADLADLINREQLEAYQPDLNTRPAVFYKNLHRYSRHFISGSVALPDIDECAEGAVVTLSGGNISERLETKTNNFGDFKIDNLRPSDGDLSLKLEYPGYDEVTKTISFKNSVDVGVIFLTKTG